MTEIEEELLQQGITLLPLKSSYFDKMMELPFDRLILATSIVEKLTLISTDRKMQRAEYAECGAKVID